MNPKAKTQAAFDGGGGLSTASLDLMEKLVHRTWYSYGSLGD